MIDTYISSNNLISFIYNTHKNKIINILLMEGVLRKWRFFHALIFYNIRLLIFEACIATNRIFKNISISLVSLFLGFRSGVGNFCSRQARFQETISLQARLIEEKTFAGHSIFEKLFFKIQKIYIRANV